MALDLIDNTPLVQVMAWYRQATSHHLDHVEPDLCRHMSPLGHEELNNL